MAGTLAQQDSQAYMDHDIKLASGGTAGTLAQQDSQAYMYHDITPASGGTAGTLAQWQAGLVRIKNIVEQAPSSTCGLY